MVKINKNNVTKTYCANLCTTDRAAPDQMTIPLNELPCFFAGDDWNFEESMAELGCTVHAYDPYVKSPNTTRENLHFYEIGKEVLTCQIHTHTTFILFTV